MGSLIRAPSGLSLASGGGKELRPGFFVSLRTQSVNRCRINLADRPCFVVTCQVKRKNYMQGDGSYHVLMSLRPLTHRTHTHRLEIRNNSPGGKMILRDSMCCDLFCRGVVGCFGFGKGGQGCYRVCVLRFGNMYHVSVCVCTYMCP